MKNKKTEILSAFVIVLLVVLLAVIIFAPLMYAEEYPLPQVGDTVATITWGELQDVPIVWGDGNEQLEDRKVVCQFANSKQFSEHGSHWLLAQNYGQFASLGEATVGQEVVIKSGDVESTYQITYSGVGTVTDDYSTVVDGEDKPLLQLDDIEDVLYMYTSYPFDSHDISMQRYVVVGRLISQRVV